MPFLLLLVVALVGMQQKWPAPPLEDWPDWASALLTWGGLAALLLWAHVLTRRVKAALERDPGQRSPLMKYFHRQRRHQAMAMLVFFVAALFLGWGHAAYQVFESIFWYLLPTPDLVVLSPLVAALLLSWARYFDVEELSHQLSAYPYDAPFMSRTAYVLLQVRYQLLLVIPPLLLMMIQQAVFRLFPSLQQSEYFGPIVVIVLLILAFTAIPLVFKRFLGLRPLPDGPLRERLLATARRLNFRCNDIMLWDTRGTGANAMITGFIPFFRYVVVTDRLIQELTEEEVEAVFGHEVGHIKHHHMPFYVGFFLASTLLVSTVWELLLRHYWPSFLEPVSTLFLLVLLAAYMYLVFGFLSRRCERQADIYGCHTVTTPVFIAALEKVAAVNGVPREKPGWVSSWMHSTIARRVAFLQAMHENPDVGPRFQRRVGLLKWGVVLGLALCLTALCWLPQSSAAFQQVLGIPPKESNGNKGP
jgi:STE24 endopeptidase